MDMDPGEGTSDGRIRRKLENVAVEIKRESDIKEEPSDDSEFDFVTQSNEIFEGGAVTATQNIELVDESDSDFVPDFDLNGVKEEVKCEKEKDLSAYSSSGEVGPNAFDDEGGESVVKSNVNRKRFNSSGKGKKRDGSRKQNKRKIPRNKAAQKRKEHKCHVCGYVASCESILTKHIRVHTGEKPYTCDVCLKRFTQKSALSLHKKIYSGEKRFECPVCSKSFAQKCTLNLHQKIHSGEKRFDCFICLKSFAVKCTLNCHLRTHIDDLPHSCLKCGQRFATEDAHKSHERRCKRRRFECYLCEYKSFTNGNLKSHMQAKHTGERQCQCEICGKGFIHKGHLNKHLATHRDQFPFRCTKCRRGFIQAEDKTAHETICERRQYQCYMCEYSTLQTTNLRNHVRAHHTGDKPFQCKWCEARFPQRRIAEDHMNRQHHSTKERGS